MFMSDSQCTTSLQRLNQRRQSSLQAVGWGHPITTGLPTIDLFFSGELLERADADGDYRERLVRLSGTGACTLPPPFTATAPAAAIFDRPPGEGVVNFLLCQQAIKYDPAFDGLYPRIARAAATECHFWLSRDPGFPWATELVRERLAAAFTAAGLDPARCLHIVEWLPRDQFWGLMERMDIYLDLPAFSGYTTAWQAAHCGLPIVTCEGPAMRQRLAAGLLRRCGIIETIAATPEEYVATAAALADAPARRARLRQQLREAVVLTDQDLTVVRAFETALLAGLATRQP